MCLQPRLLLLTFDTCGFFPRSVDNGILRNRAGTRPYWSTPTVVNRSFQIQTSQDRKKMAFYKQLKRGNPWRFGASLPSATPSAKMQKKITASPLGDCSGQSKTTLSIRALPRVSLYLLPGLLQPAYSESLTHTPLFLLVLWDLNGIC